jgi:hypothetical protein
VLDLILDVPVRAVYAVELHMTRAPDFGQLRIQVDGKEVAATFDGYGPTVVPSGSFPVGSFDLGPGPRKVSFMIVGKNGNATGFLAGIDFIRLSSPAQVPASRAPSIVAPSSGPPNLARLGIRTTLEIWNGHGTVDHAALTYGTNALTEANRKNWLWSFRWSTTVPGAKSAVLVATTEAPSPSDSRLNPAGFVGQKEVPDGVPPPYVTREFSSDVGTWMHPAPQAVLPIPQAGGSVTGPQRIYMRIVLLDGNGQPIGLPSSTVTLMRGRPQAPLTGVFAAVEKLKAETEAMLAKASVYEVKILAHKPVTFPLEHKWGCVKLLKNPYYGNFNYVDLKASHPLAGYKPGEEYCPPKDPQFYEKSTGDWILTGLGGWVKAYEGLAHYYDEAKNYVATKFAEAAPCEMLGKKLGSDCEDALAQLAGNAMSAGLVAVGVPPTLPDLAALGDIAEGKIVDGAVDYSCKAFESQGGVCTPEMRQKLAKLYEGALDQLRAEIKKQGKEPDCGIKKSGLLPLPCFTNYPGTDVKPAAGSIYEPSAVTVRVTRVKPDPDFPMGSCSVSVSMYLKNYFQGAQLGGVHVKPSPIEGAAFVPASSAIPPLALGKSVDVPLVFTQIKPYALPGLYGSASSLWGLAGWTYLYNGGKGSLSAGLMGDQPVKLPTGGFPTKIACGEAVVQRGL